MDELLLHGGYREDLVESAADEADMAAAETTERGPDRVKIARVFDSAHPVRTRDELFGRNEELQQLLAAAVDFGQHSIIHGARGSGKTSLARVFGDHADQNGVIVIYMACEPGATFADLLTPYLRALPSGALDPSARARFKDELARLPAQFGPRTFVDLLAERVTAPTVFIFDEFDRVVDAQVKDDVAAAMKLLSDSLSSVLFMLVGIARSVSDVVDSHPSLRRHMRVVSLGRIAPESVGALIAAGELSTGVSFDADARAIIARASCGSPFHVRLFCHHAALAAVRHGSAVVSGDDARAGLKTAIEHWAAMNIDDARRFVALIDAGRDLSGLEKAARTAALNDRLSADADGAASLQESLRVEDLDQDSLIFQDSMAPQFLISCIILAEKPSDAKAPHALIREDKNALTH
uniref:ATP-binding protein n=1 Tax=uncultured Sphingomonas sp. TaxID=158754 RepID=UPI0035CB9E14